MQMTIEIATLVAGVMILVGAIISAGIIYAGLEKVAESINKQN